MRFIDLFSGLGGFHLALRSLGHTCVFASEIDEGLRDIYEKNFGMTPVGDIRKVRTNDIPPHEILCAGFPCQPFSKAGSQDGLDDPELGPLYKDILRIIHSHRPKFVIMENVPNLENHDDGKTWARIERRLRREGYDVELTRLSPHHFGIPQIRDRIYIVASVTSLRDFRWPTRASQDCAVSIKTVLDRLPDDALPLGPRVLQCLDVWQEFLNRLPKSEKVPHPLWSMEFGATYPYENIAPSKLSTAELRAYRGSYGRSLRAAEDREHLFSLLPSHARTAEDHFPPWKVQFIKKNRDFYQRHKSWLDIWKQSIREFPSSFQKLEWNCQGESVRRLDRYVLQQRASGIRVKRPTTAPSLVAMTATQVPIITWERRYMTPKECKRLQSMEELEHLPSSPTRAYAALGNAINVEVARRVAESLVGRASRLSALIQPLRMPVASGKME